MGLVMASALSTDVPGETPFTALAKSLVDYSNTLMRSSREAGAADRLGALCLERSTLWATARGTTRRTAGDGGRAPCGPRERHYWPPPC